MSRQKRTRENERRPEAPRDDVQKLMADMANVVRTGLVYQVMPGNNGYHTEETVAQALGNASGRLSIASACLGISIQSLRDRIGRSKILQDVVESIRVARVDIAEDRLDALVQSGSEKSVIFTLSTLGKDRGYGATKDVAPANMTREDVSVLEAKFAPVFAAIRDLATEIHPVPAEVKAIATVHELHPASAEEMQEAEF